jgi:transposase
MRLSTLPTPEVVEIKRLDHLPLVGAMLRELAVKDTLDAPILPHERHEVTVGECVEALVLTILTGEHALSRVADTLAGYELAVIFQRPLEAAHFHDNRLGRALDALWTAGLDRLYGAVISQAIQRYALELTRLHTDATSLKVYGAYERDAEEEGPLVTYGYSRDHRPDLKQLLFGLTVTADGVPVWGHVTDGNCRDSTEHRFHITQLRQHLPDLGEPLLVADSKFFAGETVALAAEHRFRFVTLLPQTVGLRQELVEAPELETLPLLWEQPGRRQGEGEAYHGTSVVRSYRWKAAAGEVQEVPLRFLVVESTQLAKTKAARLAAAQQAEQAMLAGLQQQWQQRTFACEADAHQAATLCVRERRLHHHQLTYTVAAEWVPAKRTTRGRPRTHAPRPQRQIWRVTWQVQEATEAIYRRAQRERRFVLASNVLDTQHLSDTELLRAYKGQPAAELSFTWAKNPAAIAPIFLETPTRIAALGCVYLIALLVYTLVERQVRKSLAERGETLPDRPAPSQRPTARTVFQLMRNVAVVTLVWGGQRHRRVTALSPVQLHVIGLLGYEYSSYALPDRNSS